VIDEPIDLEDPVPEILAFAQNPILQGVHAVPAADAGCEKPLESERPSGCWRSSRGGTRTRDPGIMSSDAPPENPCSPPTDAP
jgi:hypothetical protein